MSISKTYHEHRLKTYQKSTLIFLTRKTYPKHNLKTYSQTSLLRTPKGQNQVSTAQRCPYDIGRECVIFGFSGTRRTVRNREVAVRRG